MHDCMTAVVITAKQNFFCLDCWSEIRHLKISPLAKGLCENRFSILFKTKELNQENYWQIS